MMRISLLLQSLRKGSFIKAALLARRFWAAAWAFYSRVFPVFVFSLGKHSPKTCTRTFWFWCAWSHTHGYWTVSLSLSVFYQPSLWVVTVQLLHLVGLFLQSLLREQLAVCHLSEKHYIYWCFHSSIFYPSSSFHHLQPLNLFSLLCEFFFYLFFSHSCSVKTQEVTALSNLLLVLTEGIIRFKEKNIITVN